MAEVGKVSDGSAIALPLDELGGRVGGREVNLAALSLSLLIHGSLIVTAAIAVSRPVEVPPLPSIAVEVITEAAFRALTRMPQVPAQVPANDEVLLPPPAVPEAASEPADAPIVATTLLTGDILADPANRALRNTLPTLAPIERIVQLCNIEAVEQVRLAAPETQPDSVSAASFAPPTLRDGVLVADGAAYRSDRQWYHLSFSCEPRADLLAVTAFSLELGDLIPETEWDSHNLIAEDVDD